MGSKRGAFRRRAALCAGALVMGMGAAATCADEPPAEVLSPEAALPPLSLPPITPSDSPRQTLYDPRRFGPDPSYPDRYNSAAQVDIYGGKHAIENEPRPAVEWGYPQYAAGPLPGAQDWFGAKNLARPQFLVFGDWRSAVADNDAGGNAIGQVATRLNLDFDLGFTGTERLHWSMGPLDQGGRFTRYQFSGDKRSSKVELNGNFNSFFFEGDVGAITAGLTGRYQNFDLPFAVGFVPLFTQNGIWLNDAVTGGAYTIPARNSPMFNISNMDITFFGAGGIVSTAAVRGRNGALDTRDARIVGVTGFAELLSGYSEFGYGYTQDTRTFAGGGDFGYHNFTLAFSRRYAGLVSNSVRAIFNVGQSPPPGAAKTADGYLVLLENSFITAHELTLVPYANLWFGEHRPQALARAAGTGGVLNNTGINFQTDGLTGFPTLDATGGDTYGGALGIEYLFQLNQQVVAEVAGLGTHGDPAGRAAKGDHQVAVGLRYQLNLTNAWILRADTMYGHRDQQKDISGFRIELRRKF
jgi:hypothetical protein